MPRIRKQALELVDHAAKNRLTRAKLPCMPCRATTDQAQIIHNMFKAVDRWMAEEAVSGKQRERLLRSFFQLFDRDQRVIGEFEREHGVRPPSFLTLSPSKRCNLKCTGCYASSNAENSTSLDFAVVDRIVREQKELWASHFTVLSGGEPLMYRSQGKGVLDLARRHPDTFFLMYTNGTLIDEQTASIMAELGNITPAISVEGYERETDERRGKGTHRKILRAMQNLRKAGVLYGISVTATRNNCETILDHDFIDYYFERNGAYYMWIFQYMPIGRSYTLDLMVTPEQRLEMFRRTQALMYRRELFVADFWNSATLSKGCISAGRHDGGGYIYIDWNGNVMPCVFNPYTTQNINNVYGSGGNLNEVIMSPLMKRIRQWQQEYLADAGNGYCRNILVPCPIRDHHGDMRAIIDDTGANPADEPAAEAIRDRAYYRGMCDYGEAVDNCTRKVWEKEYCLSGTNEESLSPRHGVLCATGKTR
jgi:MoaA/NifB/PqqE/SkfB family radical SAM enzyme